MSDDSLGYASCEEGFSRRGDVNRGDPRIVAVVAVVARRVTTAATDGLLMRTAR